MSNLIASDLISSSRNSDQINQSIFGFLLVLRLLGAQLLDSTRDRRNQLSMRLQLSHAHIIVYRREVPCAPAFVAYTMVAYWNGQDATVDRLLYAFHVQNMGYVAT